MSNLNALAARVHAANEKWWRDPSTGEPIERNRGEMLMLMVSELSEAMEGARKDLMDDHLPERKMEEVEIADCMVRLLDYVAGHGYKLLPFSGKFRELSGNKGEDLLGIVSVIVLANRYTTPAQSEYYLAMIYISLLRYAEHYKLDLWGAFEEKMAYNATRHDHTFEGRLEAGGKKW